MKVLSLIAALAILIAVAAVVFFFGGFYNVAATQPDLGVVAWALEYIRDASINRHAVDQPPPCCSGRCSPPARSTCERSMLANPCHKAHRSAN
jgi:hypothetical protein